MQRYKDKSVHARGQAGAGRVHPELPAPARHGHPHARPMDIHSRVYMLGGAEPAWGQWDKGGAGLRPMGLHILEVPPSPLGAVLGWG